MSAHRVLTISVLLAALTVIGMVWFHVAGQRDHFPSAKPPYVLSDYTIQFERTACFGNCPDFHLTIYPDGRTLLRMPASYPYQPGRTFSGIQDIELSSRIHRPMQEQLIHTLERGQYWKLQSNYSRKVTDNPGTRVEVATPQRSWAVHVYAVPCRSDQWDPIGDESFERVPDVFCDLAKQLDTVACETFGQGIRSSPDPSLVPIWPPHCEPTL